MTRHFSWILAALLLGGTAGSNADEAISVTVRPAITTAKSNAQVRVVLARNDQNRALIWEVDGPNYYRSSAMELDGASAARTYTFIVRDLPAGSYEVRARVRRKDDSVVISRTKILVTAGRPAD